MKTEKQSTMNTTTLVQALAFQHGISQRQANLKVLDAKHRVRKGLANPLIIMIQEFNLNPEHYKLN